MRFRSSFGVDLALGAALVCSLLVSSAFGGDALRVVKSGKVLSTDVTMYGGGRALVTERRVVSLPGGLCLVEVEGVPRKMDPDSVRVVFDDDGTRILEQKYAYDLLTPENLYRRYVGKKLKVYLEDPRTGKKVLKDALLISYVGQPIFEIDGEVTFGYLGRVIFPEVPKGLLTAPTLLLKVDGSGDGERELTLTYETSGFSWKIVYSLFFDRKKGEGLFDGWVTLNNKSGGSFRDAAITLVAGEIKKLPEASVGADKAVYTTLKAPSVMMGEAKEEKLFEYHSYELPVRVSISSNESKRVLFLGARRVELKEEYFIRGQEYYYRNRYSQMQEKIPVSVRLVFKNEEGKGPGVPLPAGVVKVYTADSGGRTRFIGEDRVSHTPVGETISLDVGKSFDVVAERKQVDFEKVGRNLTESSFVVKIWNHGDSDVTVKVIETLPGEWRILSSSHSYKKMDYRKVRFDVPVGAGGSAELKYRVRVRY